MIVGISILAVLNLCIIIFAWVLWRNRKQLGHKEVKDKIGAMYFALDPEKPYVGTYVIVYLFRRSLFVVVTFSLYYRPGL